MGRLRFLIAALAGLVAAAPVAAHVGDGGSGGFGVGFMHPLLGWDHLVAMVAVGLWGAMLGGAARWVLPLTFPLVMAAGAGLGAGDVALPGVEIAIALSAVVLGGLLAWAARPPVWLAALVVGYAAVFHGHAHGAEVLARGWFWPSLAGMVAATLLLHLGGLGVGVLARRASLGGLPRALGLVIAAAGAGFLHGAA
jgi:urease accessory protein